MPKIFQPNQPQVFLLAWGKQAHDAKEKLARYAHKVIRASRLKYDFYPAAQEHQMQLLKGFKVEEVTDSKILAAFEGVVLLEVPITSFPKCKEWEIVNFKGFVKTFDPEPQGPASNNRYWRNFEVSDAMGNVVKGTAWSTVAQTTWTKNTSAEFYNATIKKKDEKVVLEDGAVVVFHEKYELGQTAPKFFKLLLWGSTASWSAPSAR